MALQTTGNTFQDAVVGAFKALFNAAEKEVPQRLEYTGLGYADDTIAIPNEQRNQVTGPSAGVLTLEGVEYGDVEKFRGLKYWIVLYKSFLIDLKTQILGNKAQAGLISCAA